MITGENPGVTATAAEAPVAAEHVRLGRSGWVLWREVALRGAGFPAERILALCDDELAAAADRLDDDRPETAENYAAVFAAAERRLTAAVRAVAADPPFREAVIWQNPGLVDTCLDKVVAGEPRTQRGRAHELTVATYLQRYCLKNDTVGFFGPLGWLRVDPDEDGLAVRPGTPPLARRTTYFEGWAVNALAEVLTARPEVRPWLRPRPAPSASRVGWVVRLPFRRPETLTAVEARVLDRCDSRRTVRDIAGEPPDPATMAALLRLRDRGVLAMDLSAPLVNRPERELAARLDGIGDPSVRERAHQPLRRLSAARDEVAAAAGDPDRLRRAGAALAGTFEELTGVPATRRPGATYAGRTLVYEDTRRAGEYRLGPAVLDGLAAPLGAVLDSALWLANAIGERYRAEAVRLLDRASARSGRPAMPLLRLLTSLLPEMGRLAETDTEFTIVDEVVAGFQDRWGRVLDLPPADAAVRRHRMPADLVAARAAREFATGPPLWSTAAWSSPDLLIGAADPAAVARGDAEFVLGELHCARNTLETRCLAGEHPEPARLRAAAEASGMGGRVVTVPRMDSSLATSRTSRADVLMLPRYTYLCIGDESMVPPAGASVLSVLDMVAERAGDDVVVRHRDGRRFSFLEVAAEPLSVLVSGAFRPVAPAAHRPRVSVGPLVLSRESWSFGVADTAWARVKDERRRYAEARRWAAVHGLPERVFARVPVEIKPVAVDFRSLPLVNLLAKLVRRSAGSRRDGVTVSEMRPDLDQLWLPGPDGGRCTAELRFVAVRDPG